MTKSMMFALALSTLSLPALARKGDVVGNGGDVLVCPGKPTQVLDLYEARTVLKLPVKAGLGGATPEEFAKSALKELERLDPVRARMLRTRIDSFRIDMSLIPNARLEDIPDSAHTVLPAGCELKQIAIQVKRKMAQDPIYIVDENLWNSLDVENQAMLMLHEVIYTDAIRYGHANSITSRYFNGLLVSNRLDSLDGASYLDLLTSKIDLFPLIALNAKGWVLVPLLDSHWTDLDSRPGIVQQTCAWLGLTMASAKEIKPGAKAYWQIAAKLWRLNSKDDRGFLVGQPGGESWEGKFAAYFLGKDGLNYQDNGNGKIDNVICKPR